MARPRSALADYLVYLVVRTVVCVVQALSWDLALAFADGLAWLAYHVDGRHRRVAADNLRSAFPELDAAAIDRRVRAVYRHFMMMLMEMIKGPRVLHRSNLDFHFRYANPGQPGLMLEQLNSSRPVIILTGHLGNWEIFGYAIGLFGARLSAIARPLDNRHLDRLLNRFRGATGQRMIAKHGEIERITALMQSGGNLALLADQDAGAKGMFVDFFGRPASTYKSISLLALEYDALIVVGAAVRESWPLQYGIFIEDVIDPAAYRGTPAAVKVITQRYTSSLERLVRRRPEQYLWLHRRWKHAPQVRKARAQAA